MAGQHRLPKSVHDEQRVVNANAEPDHRSQGGREGGNIEEIRDEKYRHLTHRQPNHRNEDWHPGGDDGAEGNQQDDNRHSDTDGLTLWWLLSRPLQGLTIGTHLQCLGVSALDRRQEGGPITCGDQAILESHIRVRNTTIRTDRGRCCRESRRRIADQLLLLDG